MHSFNLKTWKQKAFFLKLGLAKAFDRIEWNFIVSALLCSSELRYQARMPALSIPVCPSHE